MDLPPPPSDSEAGSDWRNPPADAAAVDRLAANARVRLPEAYLDLLRSSDGGEGPLEMDSGWFRLWRADEVIEMDAGYGVSEFLPGLFSFGSDGGGGLFAFDCRGTEPWPVVFLEDSIGMEIDHAITIAANFSEFAEQLGKSGPESEPSPEFDPEELLDFLIRSGCLTTLRRDAEVEATLDAHADDWSTLSDLEYRETVERWKSTLAPVVESGGAVLGDAAFAAFESRLPADAFVFNGAAVHPFSNRGGMLSVAYCANGLRSFDRNVGNRLELILVERNLAWAFVFTDLPEGPWHAGHARFISAGL